ncbi:hypothetical protein [Flavobacterium sp.]|jgi:GT2 family glycosyltransferase|uniref:hypothetical protein n=1 Tax=Flavobacterium sp. TaxID=239 RepID=UPI0037C10EA5
MNISDNIFIVIVLYKTNLEDSKTIQSLNKCLSSSIDVFVFDNSPIPQYEKEKFIYDKLNITYYYDILNPGLAIAYNNALNRALFENKKWLLLLDQDTLISQFYIDELFSKGFDNFSNQVVAIIPKVVSRNNNLISPAKMFVGGICRPINLKEGIVKLPITAINSGTLLRTDYMNSVDGFNIDFSLDMLDHWYFRKIYKDGKFVFLMKSSIEQDLSVSINFEDNVSFDRYKKMLNSEYLFIKEEGFLGEVVFRLRLFFKIIKQIRFNNADYYKYSINRIFSNFK